MGRSVTVIQHCNDNRAEIRDPIVCGRRGPYLRRFALRCKKVHGRQIRMNVAEVA